MKKLFTKSFYILGLILALSSITLPALAQFTSVTLESGNLYSAIAKDSHNNIYVIRHANSTQGQIVKYTNGAGTPTVIYSGFLDDGTPDNLPWGLVVDSNGNVYFSTEASQTPDVNGGAGAIIKLTYNSGNNTYSASTYQSGNYYTALAMDASNNLYTIAYDLFANTAEVVEYAAGTPAGTPDIISGTVLYNKLELDILNGFDSNPEQATGLAVAPNGDVYVADSFDNNGTNDDGGHIYKLTKANNYAATIVSTNQYATSLAVDALNNLYATQQTSATVGTFSLAKYTNGAGAPVNVYTPLHTDDIYFPFGIAILNTYEIYVADGNNPDTQNGGAVLKLTGPMPTLATTGTLAALSTSQGTASATTSFNVSGTNLSAGITITPPTGFEISTSQTTGFSSSVSLPGSGTIGSTPIYVRLAAADAANTYSGNVVITSLDATTVNVATASSIVHSPSTTINSITLAATSPTNAASVQYTATFGAAVTGLTAGNFSLTTTGTISGASVSSVSGTGPAYTITVNTGSGNGTIGLNLNNATGLTPGISTTLPFAGQTYTINKTPPSYVANSGSFTSNDPGNSNYARVGDIVTLTFTATEVIQTPVITIAGHSVTPTNTGGNTWTASYTMQSSDTPGTIPFTVMLADLAGNTNTITSASVTDNLVFNETIPKPVSGSYTSNNSISNTVAKVGDVVTLSFVTNEAVQQPAVTIAGHTVTAVNTGNDGITWTASYTMTSADASGNIPFSFSLQDLAGNVSNGGVPYTNITTNQNILFDKTNPTVSGITLLKPATSPTIATPLSYQVTFSEPVYNIGPGDFILTTTGTANGTIYQTSSGSSANIINVTVNNVTGLGTIRLDIINPPNSIRDDAGNTLQAGFTAGQAYTIIAKPAAATSPATAVLATGATLNGQVNDNGDATTVSFIYGTVADLSSNTTTTPASTGGNISAGSGNTNVALNLAGLLPSTTYYYEVTATNTAGTSAGAIFSFVTPSQKPSATTFLASAVGVNNATLNGAASDNGTATTVTFTYSTDPGLLNGITVAAPNGNLAAGSGNTNFSLMLTGLSPGTNYYYRLNATNSYGTVSGIIAPFTTSTPQSISLSYNGPQTYIIGAPITPLAPNSSGVAAPNYSTVPSTTIPNIPYQGGIATDTHGNLYIAYGGSSSILEVPAGGGATINLGSGIVGAGAVAVDAAGNVYAADYGAGKVYKIPAGNGPQVQIGSGFSTPTGIAVDAAGNVYVADAGNNAVKKVTPGGVITTLGSGFDVVIGLTLDAAGNVYVTDTNNGAVKEIPVGGGSPITIATGLNAPWGIAIDPAGNIFVAENGNGANDVKEIPAGGGAAITVGSGLNLPRGVAVDISGNLYVGDYGNNVVKQFKPLGGYYLNSFLPAGLSFNGATGAINGTPSAASPTTNYVVAAYNSTNMTQASVTITVSSPFTAPTKQAEKLIFTNNTETSVTVSWANGNGTSRAVFVAQTAVGIPTEITNSTTYAASTTFGSGSEAGTSGWFCVYNGTGSATPVTGLTAGTIYRFMVVEYNGTPGGEAYLHASGGAPANDTTIRIVPSMQAEKLNFSNTTINSTVANWTDGNGVMRAVFAAQTSVGIPTGITDGTTYTASSIFGQGSEAGTSGWFCVYNGSGSSTPITGLQIGTTYRVMVVEYDTASGTIRYLPASGGAPANVTTIMEVPSLQAIHLNFSNTTAAGTTVSWTSGNGTSRAVFLAQTNHGVPPDPTNATTYSAASTFGGGSEIGSSGWYCVYNGSGSAANINGLLPSTTYRAMVIEYDGAPGNEMYLAPNGGSPANVTTLMPSVNGYSLASQSAISDQVITDEDHKVVANNILTPNGDGVNDTWLVKNIEFYPNNSVTVIDRSGNVVFSKKGYLGDWNGTYRGALLNEGTYYYSIDIGNSTPIKGFFTVIKDR